MPIAVSEEHEDLRRTVRRWLDTHCPPDAARATLEAPPGELPPVWKELADQGWLGLHVAEADGGQGFGLAEVAVVLEELGWSLAPGPVFSTLLTSAAVVVAGDPGGRAGLLGGLVDGSTPAGVHLGPGALELVRSDPDGSVVVTGSLRPVLGAPTARLVLAPIDGAGWCVLDVEADDLAVDAVDALDPTRPLGVVTVGEAVVPARRRLVGLDARVVQELALVLASAESAGGAAWCLNTASEYAKVRVQFGRPIGQFQAIKHKLADMLVLVEQSAAVAWDAAQAASSEEAADATGERALAAAVAGAIALDGFATCAKQCVQVLGGIGFTWEHDAHLYLKRAVATRQLLGDPGALHDRVATAALAGARRSLAADLPPEADAVRAEIAPMAAHAGTLAGSDQRRYLVESGLLVPHWPRPWGRGASALEQLVIDEQLAAAGVLRPNLGVGAWALPTLVAHGTPAQQERWVGPTLLGGLAWCQLFSEPGAGSDLAGLSTRADPVEGGWRLNGQKVWTSLATVADWGICMARSDPDAPKHDGITYFIVDMKSDGIDIRPLRELTGAAMFNEVFLTDVFVPDECVVGAPGEGWGIGRTTLANERVSMSSGATFGAGAESVLRRLGRLGDDAPPGALVHLGALLAEAQSIRLMGHRAGLRSLSGLDPGSGASVRKLLGAEHEQRVQEMGLSLYGAEGATMDGSAARWAQGFLATRCLTIAGGTSEVQRNVIAERLLGQPRDPEPGS
jgi:alkylation response protein AidB-like acyl-CoA dehydrogenase